MRLHSRNLTWVATLSLPTVQMAITVLTSKPPENFSWLPSFQSIWKVSSHNCLLWAAHRLHQHHIALLSNVYWHAKARSFDKWEFEELWLERHHWANTACSHPNFPQGQGTFSENLIRLHHREQGVNLYLGRDSIPPKSQCLGNSRNSELCFFCFDRCLPAVHINTTCKKDSSVPHELAEGFIVCEFPVVLLREGMINILQAPLLRQLGRGLLLYRLLRRQSEQRDNRSSKGWTDWEIRLFLDYVTTHNHHKATLDLGALPLSFPPDYYLGPRRLFSSSWFSSLSFLYVSSFSSSLRSHSRWRCCPSSRHSPSLCPNLCLHRFPWRKRRERRIYKKKQNNKRWCNVVREEKSKAFQLNKLTSFFRFFVLAGFPSFSFFFASFFFFGRPFFLDGTSLSDISGSSSKRGGERKIEAWKKDSYQNQMNDNLLNARLIPAEHNYAQQKLRYGHGGFGDLWPRLNCDTCYIRYSLSERCK